MSRIHDALRKAEEERAAGGPTSPNAVAAPHEVVFEESDATAPETPSAAPAEEMAEASLPMTIESVTARCPVSRWRMNPKDVLFQESGDRSVGAEEFRTLRSRLYQIRERQPLQTLLVASALPGEGKTFVATNLAQAIVQQQGRRVLLIDADLRLPRAHRALGAPQNPGLSDYLRGEADLFSILQRGPQSNLFFIPGGKTLSNPVELIGNGRLRPLLNRVAPIFDWIIVDSPPAVPLSDASLIAEICDGVLMVVLAGSTPFDMAQRARHEFREKHVVGVVLNRVAPNSAYSAYYYGYPETAAKPGA